MAGKYEIRCVGPSYRLADRKAGAQRSINLYMSQVEGLGEERQVILRSAPGMELFCSMGADARGAVYAGSRLFVVAGPTLYEVSRAGVKTALGTLATGTGYVCMSQGRDQVIIVDGLYGYVLSLNTSAFAQITDADFRGSDWVTELDGYSIFIAPGTDQFYLSAIDDASDYDALDFSSSDATPDILLTHRVLKRELYLFGELSTEVWVDSGGADFPLTRYNSTPIDVGIVGRRAAVIAGDSIIFVGNTTTGGGYVYRIVGHQPQRISTLAVEQAIAASTDLAECSIWTYKTQGAEFIGINAPGMSSTWVYDLSTTQWHERAEMVSGEYVPWRADQIVFAFGNQYALAGENLYRIGDDLVDFAGDILPRERTWPHLIAPSMEPVSYRGLELACTTGTGGTITLEMSNDGGSTFGPPLLRSLGQTGDRMRRVRWLGLGSAVDRVFRLRCTDAVELAIHAAAVDA